MPSVNKTKPDLVAARRILAQLTEYDTKEALIIIAIATLLLLKKETPDQESLHEGIQNYVDFFGSAAKRMEN